MYDDIPETQCALQGQEGYGMKRWLSALLVMVMLAQALPMSAMASVGRVLSDEELDRPMP